MRFSRILEQIYHRPWAITAEGYSGVRRLIESKLIRSTDDSADISEFVNPRKQMEIDANGIARIDICGVLGKGLSPIERSCGNTDYEVIESEIEQALQMGAKGFFFEINSTGGQCTGNSEVSDLIAGISVPTVAYADDIACSAAYAIAASCDQIFASPSATIGSIGCIVPWVDQSRMWADQGLEWAPITNAEGDLKGAMHGPSLTDAQKESLMEYVQDMFDLFKAGVLRNRAVPPEAMRGQSFVAGRALGFNLIDGIILEDAAYSILLGRIR